MKKPGKQLEKVREWLMEGYQQHRRGRLDEAQRLYRKVLDVDSNNAQVLSLLAAIYLDRGAVREAANLLKKSLAVQPAQAGALCDLGICHERLGEVQQAIACYRQAIRLQPDFAGAHYNLGLALRRAGCREEAIDAYGAAIALDAGFVDALNNRGNLLTQCGRHAEALEDFSRAIALRPDDARAYNNRGVCYWNLRQHADAIRDYQQALARDAAYVDAQVNCAQALLDLRQYDEAQLLLQAALQTQPAHAAALAALYELKTRSCDWRSLDDVLQKLRARVVASDAVKPFVLLTAVDDAALQLQVARQWYASHFVTAPRSVAKTELQQRLRIAYLSDDFHEHATSQLLVRVLELHDRTQFNCYAISTGIDDASPMRARVQAAVEHFVDMAGSSDAAIAAYIRQAGIDVLIDLKGYTQGGRVGVLAARAAPVQIGYLGYPGTLGADCVDYFIADPVVLPPALYGNFSEKIISLAGCYQCNDNTRAIAPSTSRAEHGLPETAFVFCCFNHHYKITPEVFAVWLRVLHAVPDSVLWLYVNDAVAQQHLLREALAAGIAEARLVFATRLPQAEHLARMQLADLFLDTFPCNAHTTCSDALWAGLPVLTCAGQSFVSRVAASLLCATGLSELVCENLQQYEMRAQVLAQDRAELRALRERLQAARSGAPFDSERSARQLERAYRAAWHRHVDGLPPEHLEMD